MRNTWKILPAALVARGAAGLWLALLVLFTAGCQVAPPLLKIGLVAPFEGRDRPVGYDAIYAARLAVREINTAGGIGGYRIALAALDDGGDPEMAQQAAAALVVDPDVVAVVGHWLPETTAVAAMVYEPAGLPLIPLPQEPLLPLDPQQLPAAFLESYAALTPFDETAGPHSAPTYDAFQLLFAALKVAEIEGQLSREAVAGALEGLEYDGLSGTVYWTPAGDE